MASSMRAVLVIFLLTCVAAAPPRARLSKYEGRYYVIHTDLTGDELREADLRMVKMAEEYHNRTKDFSGDISNKFPFFLFRRENDYHAAGGAEGSAGFFDPNSNTLMAVAGEEVSDETWHVVQHEGFHQFARAVIGGDLPIWVNEGLAEYFGEGIFTGDGFVTGVVPPQRLQRIRRALRTNKFRPMRDFMFLAHEEWNKQLSMANYDQAWSMVQFLAHGENGRYQAPFVTFMRAIGRGQQWQRAWLDSFGSAEGFEAKWKQYWLRMTDNASAPLYGRATLQTLTGVLARASAQKQFFADFDSFFKDAQAGKIKIDDADWLPPTLISAALTRVDEMRKQGVEFALVPAKGSKGPMIACSLSGGVRLTGSYRLAGGHVAEVKVDPPLR
jgi:hypothetical protein